MKDPADVKLETQINKAMRDMTLLETGGAILTTVGSSTLLISGIVYNTSQQTQHEPGSPTSFQPSSADIFGFTALVAGVSAWYFANRAMHSLYTHMTKKLEQYKP